MALELGEVVAKFDGGDAEVAYDVSGGFETVKSTSPVAVASFTMPSAGHVIATMWFSPGSATSATYTRELAVAVGGSRIEAQLTYAAGTHILSCYGDLPAGAATILVSCANTYNSGATTPTRLRVITWRD